MKRAFTLMELMVVVGIMSFLGVAATGGYNALQRGMAERGATAVATSLLQAAKERAMVDRSPTVVFCYNRLLREATDEDNAIVVGEAVAIRRAGRVSWAQGKFIADEFADLYGSYDVETDVGKIQERKGMKLWRFDDAEMSQMRYSVVADAVYGPSDEQEGLYNGTTYGGWAEGEMAGNSNLNIRAYAFYNLDKSAHEPPSWTIGDGYGFEFASTQLPHNFVFGSGSTPSKVGDVSFVKAIYFDPDNYSDNDQVDVYFCKPDAGGMPRPNHRAGTASSKEGTTI